MKRNIYRSRCCRTNSSFMLMYDTNIHLVCNAVPIIYSSTSRLWGEASPQIVLTYQVQSVARTTASARPISILKTVTTSRLVLGNYLPLSYRQYYKHTL